MQKANLYEAILLVNRGLDEAVQGLERLKRAKNSGLDPACFDEKVALFETHRASINSYFCNNVGRNEDRDVTRFEQRHHEYERDMPSTKSKSIRTSRLSRRRQRIEGKPPKVRFLTEEEQREWERQYTKTGRGNRLRSTAGVREGAVKLHLLQELLEINQAFENVLRGLERMEKVTLFDKEHLRCIRAEIESWPRRC